MADSVSSSSSSSFSSSSSSSLQNYKKPTSSSSSPFFSFTNFTSKEPLMMMSPTSILDSHKNPFSVFRNSFWSPESLPDHGPQSPPGPSSPARQKINMSPRNPSGEPKRPWDSKAVGLGGVVDFDDGGDGDPPPLSSPATKLETRMVLFGSQLKIQIPPVSPPASFSDSPGRVLLAGSMSASEIESSEDYTRVIARGPNPRTTHIFDNCVIESSCFHAPSQAAEEGGFVVGVPSDDDDDDDVINTSKNFLSFCFYCKKSLSQGKDIYMYRGERAFCSRECRYQGILMEEGMDK